MKQSTFKGKEFKKEMRFGGALLKGNARGPRPLSTKLPMHTVLRTNGASLRRPAIYRRVNDIVTAAEKKYGIRVYSYANVGSHIHMLGRVPNRRLWPKFIREVTGRIAQLCGKPGEKFWKHKPWTRVIAGWKKAYQTVKDYLYLNQMEGEGNIKRSEVPTFKAYKELFMDDW